MKRLPSWTRLLLTLLLALMAVGVARAQDNVSDDEIFAIIHEIAGDDWDGNPCSLTLEQRTEIDERIETELDLYLGFADIPCDGTDPGNGGWGDPGDADKDRIMEILLEVAGADWDGNPCSLTEEQRAEIDARVEDELGYHLGFSDIPCDGTDPGNGGWGDPGDADKDRIMEILLEVAGADWDGNPCSLTEEQRAEIDARVEDELGYHLGFSDIPCDGTDPGDGGWGDPVDDSVERRVYEILFEVAGADWDGNPCSLTEEQRAEIDARIEDELGLNIGFSDIPCDSIVWEDPWEGPGHGDYDETMRRIYEIIVEVTGEELQGDPCDLPAEQREEINRRLAEEFPGDCPPVIYCPDDCPEVDDEETEQIIAILLEVAGEDWDGNPCSLTLEQRAEIDARIEAELGLNIGLAQIGCDSLDFGLTDDHREAIQNMLATSGVRLLPSEASVVTLAPNPASHSVRINLVNNLKDAVLVVRDARGTAVERIDLDGAGSSLQLDVSHLTAGNYFVSIQAGGKASRTIPFVVVR